MAQGNLAEALKAYQDSLAIADRLAKADPGNAGWQRDLSVSYDKVGDVLVAQGNLAEALKSYQDSLAISERLAKADPGNAGWQRDLSVSYDKVGDVLVAQGNLAEALKAYQDSLAIGDRLAKADPGNAGWQRDLAMSYGQGCHGSGSTGRWRTGAQGVSGRVVTSSCGSRSSRPIMPHYPRISLGSMPRSRSWSRQRPPGQERCKRNSQRKGSD